MLTTILIIAAIYMLWQNPGLFFGLIAFMALIYFMPYLVALLIVLLIVLLVVASVFNTK